MSNMIFKGAKIEKSIVTDTDLQKINQYATEDLKAENVFTFNIAICDNEVDRDFECFPISTLKELQNLFVGKTIMKDHNAKTDNQIARIFDTEIVQSSNDTLTKNNEIYSKLVAHCYAVQTDSNKDFITEIKAGIKKEVSVGCSVGSAICSICGTDNRETYCKHYNGNEYDGKTCFFKLMNAKDAYEVSFVAVPAQKNAGVTKNYQENQSNKQEQSNTENEDLLNLENDLNKSFLFVENEKEEVKTNE